MITLENVTKTFGTGESALSDINISIEKGEFVFFVGPSGSGKTTLFRLLIREILPTKGFIHINDINVTKLSKGKVPNLRRKIGVVFQDLKLLTDRTIFENILLPLQISGEENKSAQTKVKAVLAQVSILDHMNKFPVQLSGGELQRVAIARALVFNPDIILADEPTGNLDDATSWEIVKLLQDINSNGTTVLMASHDTDIVKKVGKRIIALEKGQVIMDESLSGKTSAEKKEHHDKSNSENKKHQEENEKKTKKEDTK